MLRRDLMPGDTFRYDTQSFHFWVPGRGRCPDGYIRSDDPDLDKEVVDVVPYQDANKPDMVNAPDHYTRLNPQPLEVIAAWKLNFPRGSAVKYLARAGFKGTREDEITDLKKARAFIEWEIKQLESKR